MKNCIAILLVLSICAPAMALTFSLSDQGGGRLRISYDLSQAANEGLRGLALTLNVTAGNGVVAADTAAMVAPFNTFIDWAADVDNTYSAVGEGHPFALITPDIVNGQYEATFPTNSFSLSMGYLDQAGAQVAITVDGYIDVSFTGTTTMTVTVALDDLRGGAVGDNLDSISGLPADLVVGPPPPPPFTLTTEVTPSCGATISVPGIGSFMYNPGEIAAITAAPAASPYPFYFWKWTGDTASIANSLVSATTIVMDSDKSITANFTLSCQQYNLTKLCGYGTDNIVNVNDLNQMISWITANKTGSLFVVQSTNPHWLPDGPKYNLTKKECGTDNIVNVSDLNCLINFINKRKTGMLFVVNCGTCGC